MKSVVPKWPCRIFTNFIIFSNLLTLVYPLSTSGQQFRQLNCVARAIVSVDECFEEFVQSGNEDKRDWFVFLENARRQNQIWYNQELHTFRIHRDIPPERRFKSTNQDQSSKDSETKWTMSEKAQNDEIPYLSSGGWINIFILKPFLPGHSDVTKNVLRQLKFMSEAQEIVADASQDPDFYGWKDDNSHAQTFANNDGTVRSGDEANGRIAKGEFRDWMRDKIRKINTHCEEDQPNQALYLIGYALHAVQDLAAHNGRTAVEHSWNSNCSDAACGMQELLPISTQTTDHSKSTASVKPKEGDPDENPDNIRLAELYSQWFLQDVKSSLPDSCWLAMKTYDGSQFSFSDKKRLFNLEWQLSVAEILRYRDFRYIYAKSSKDVKYEIRWNTDDRRENNEVIKALWGGSE
jgi:hypothetical protein